MSDRVEIGNNWFYLTVPSRVGIMKMIGRHASVTLAQQQPAAVTAFSSHSVCTILLFAQNYAGHKVIAALMNTRSTDATDVVRNNRVHSSCKHGRTPRPPYSFSLSFFRFFLMRRYVTGTAITIDRGREENSSTAIAFERCSSWYKGLFKSTACIFRFGSKFLFADNHDFVDRFLCRYVTWRT